MKKKNVGIYLQPKHAHPCLCVRVSSTCPVRPLTPPRGCCFPPGTFFLGAGYRYRRISRGLQLGLVFARRIQQRGRRRKRGGIASFSKEVHRYGCNRRHCRLVLTLYLATATGICSCCKKEEKRRRDRTACRWCTVGLALFRTRLRRDHTPYKPRCTIRRLVFWTRQGLYWP